MKSPRDRGSKEVFFQCCRSNPTRLTFPIPSQAEGTYKCQSRLLRGEDLGSTNNKQEFLPCNKKSLQSGECSSSRNQTITGVADLVCVGREKVGWVRFEWCLSESIAETPCFRSHHRGDFAIQLELAIRWKRYSNLVQLCSNLSCGPGGIISLSSLSSQAAKRYCQKQIAQNSERQNRYPIFVSLVTRPYHLDGTGCPLVLEIRNIVDMVG